MSDPLYQATRAGVLSRANPFWFNGTAGLTPYGGEEAEPRHCYEATGMCFFPGCF